MINDDNLLSQQALSDLAALKGQTLNFTTGSDLFPSTMSDVVVVVGDQTELVIAGRVGPVEFEGELDDLSHIVINEMPTYRADVIISENAHSFSFKGQLITDVLVLRERIVAFHRGQKTWEYFSDTGVTLRMSGGFVKVQRFSHFDEIMGIMFSQEKPSSTLRSTPEIYINDQFNEYVVESTEHSVAELLLEAKP